MVLPKGNNIPRQQIGVNLGAISPEIGEYSFLDLFKFSSKFVVQESIDFGKSHRFSPTSLSLRPDGYPSVLTNWSSTPVWQVAWTKFGTAQTFHNGTYICKHDGLGQLNFGGDAVNYTLVAPGRYEVTVLTLGKGIELWISRTNSSNPVRNIRFVLPQYEQLAETDMVFDQSRNATIPVGFNPRFLDALKPFDVIRFTDWQKVPATAMGKPAALPLHWFNRTLPFDQTQADAPAGVAYEYILALSNSLPNISGIWLSLHFASTNDYILNLAQMVRDGLRPELDVYVDYSDTLYLNSAVDQRRANEMFGLWKSVFANATIPRTGKLTCVVNNWVPEYMRQNIMSTPSDAQNNVDAVAFEGTYTGNDYGSGNLDLASILNKTIEQLTDDIWQRTLATEDDNYLGQSVAGPRGLPVMISRATIGLFVAQWRYRYQYTGALRNVNGNATLVSPTLTRQSQMEQTLENELIAIGRSWAMKDIYLDILERWRRMGGGLFIFDTLVAPVQPNLQGGVRKTGYYSLLESLDSDFESVPKYAAITAFKRGERGAYPITSDDLPPPPPEVPCNPNCEYGTCFNGTCHCWAGYAGNSCSTRSSSFYDCLPKNIGVNPNGIDDWSTEWVFVDVLKSAREWITQNVSGTPWSTNDLANFRFDESGYPLDLGTNQAVGTLMIRDVGAHIEEGIYTVLYDGDGLIQLSMDGVKIVRREAGKILMYLTPQTTMNNGIFLRIVRTNPDNRIRNLRVLRPGFTDTQARAFPFHPLFLNNFEKYSIVRFWSWASEVDTTWSTRTTPSFYTQSGAFGFRGVAIEYWIQLCNTVGASPWIIVPALADDDYVRQMATLIRDTLRPDVNVYVEWANEVWGDLFQGGKYAKQQGLALQLSTNPDQARFCFAGLRIQQIAVIFREVFGEQNIPKGSGRLRFTINSQAVNADVTNRMLTCMNTSRYIDAVAIGPYYGDSRSLTYGGTTNEADVMHLDDFLDTALPTAVNVSLGWVRQHAALARKFNVSLYTYECGYGVATSDGTWVQQNLLNAAAQTDERMYQISKNYFKGLRENGVNVTLQFVSTSSTSRYGAWGLLESSDQNPIEAPKYRAYKDLIQEIARNEICPLSNLTGLEHVGCPSECSGNGTCLADGSCQCYFGYQGVDCSQYRTVTYTTCTYLCGGRGTCTLQRTDKFKNYYACACQSGYSGSGCDKFKCDTDCSFSGKCVGPNQCKCYKGFSGPDCAFDCCGGNGRCGNSTLGEPRCLCDKGYTFNSTQNKCVPDCSRCEAQGVSCAGPDSCECPLGCKFGTCNVTSEICVCWSGYTGPDCSRPTTTKNALSPLGINLGGLAYYSSEWPFVDVFKSAMDWIPQRKADSGEPYLYVWNSHDPIDLRPDGYVSSMPDVQLVVTLMMRDLKGHVPSGRYVCLYDGEGIIEFGMDAKVVSEEKGRIEINVTPSLVRDNGIYLQLTKTNPANPLRNIRVIMPGFEHSHDRFPFHPLFLKSLEPYKAIRFMTWSEEKEIIDWSQRTLPTHRDQTSRSGVAYEYQVLLANTVGAHMWCHVPINASDNYMFQMATLIKSQLRSDLRLQVELSNEVWNSFFYSGKVAQKEATRLGMTYSYQWYSEKVVRMCRIFKHVFGDQKSRVTCVMSTQTVNTWYTNGMLTHKNASKEIDAVALAAYFDCNGIGSNEKAPLTALWNVSRVFKECWDDLPKWKASYQAQMNIIRSHGLQAVAYESGPSIMESQAIYNGYETPGLTALFTAVNRAPEMRSLYRAYLQATKEIGVKQFNHFVSTGQWSKYGSWGLLEYQDQPLNSSAKYLAIQDFVSSLSQDELISLALLPSSSVVTPPIIANLGETNVSVAVQVAVPAGSLTQPGNLEFTFKNSSFDINPQQEPLPSSALSYQSISFVLSLLPSDTAANDTNTPTNNATTSLAAPVTVRLEVTNGNLTLAQNETFKLFFFDTNLWSWIDVDEACQLLNSSFVKSVYDPQLKIMETNICHFTQFGVFSVYLPPSPTPVPPVPAVAPSPGGFSNFTPTPAPANLAPQNGESPTPTIAPMVAPILSPTSTPAPAAAPSTQAGNATPTPGPAAAPNQPTATPVPQSAPGQQGSPTPTPGPFANPLPSPSQQNSPASSSPIFFDDKNNVIYISAAGGCFVVLCIALVFMVCKRKKKNSKEDLIPRDARGPLQTSPLATPPQNPLVWSPQNYQPNSGFSVLVSPASPPTSPPPPAPALLVLTRGSPQLTIPPPALPSGGLMAYGQGAPLSSPPPIFMVAGSPQQPPRQIVNDF